MINLNDYVSSSTNKSPSRARGKTSSLSTSSTRLKDLPFKTFSYNPKTIDNEISKIFAFMNNYNSSNKNQIISQKFIKSSNKTKELIKKASYNVLRENMIMDLKEDLEYHKITNDSLVQYKRYSDEVSNYYRKNCEDIGNYKKRLEYELRDFLKLINDYESKKSNYIKEKELLINSNKNIITYKLEEQKKLKEKIKKLNEDLEQQTETLNTLNNILENYNQESLDYLFNLDKNELEFHDKFTELNSEYDRLLSQYRYFFDKEMEKRKNKLIKDGKNFVPSSEENDVNCQLTEDEFKNIFLREIISKIKIQLQEIEEQNKKIKYREDKIKKFTSKLFDQQQSPSNKNKNSIVLKLDYSNSNEKYEKININSNDKINNNNYNTSNVINVNNYISENDKGEKSENIFNKSNIFNTNNNTFANDNNKTRNLNIVNFNEGKMLLNRNKKINIYNNTNNINNVIKITSPITTNNIPPSYKSFTVRDQCLNSGFNTNTNGSTLATTNKVSNYFALTDTNFM